MQENHYDPWGLNLAGIETQGNPNHEFQYNGKEKQEEFGLNWLDYGARMYDNQLGRMLQIDPLADDFFSINPYNYCLNDPMNVIDPDGRSAEIIIDMDKGTVTFKSHFYFYGSAASKDLADKATQEISDTWNAGGIKASFNGKAIDVNFEVTSEVVSTEKAEDLAKDNKSFANNFVAIETQKSSGYESSFMTDNGNSGVFLKEDILSKQKTIAHEYGHGLGWYDDSQIFGVAGRASVGGRHDLVGKQVNSPEGRYAVPTIMVARGTDQYHPQLVNKSNAPFGKQYVNADGTVKHESRIVTQRDIDRLNINDRRNSVGGINNRICKFK